MIIAFLLSSSAVTIGTDLVISAAREPIEISASTASIEVISAEQIEAVNLPQIVDVLRLSPGVSISRSGQTGSQTQVRIRGAEANHTLVFVDGIAANDAASSGEFRWETLGSDGIGRVEIIRGPQSVLWGSESIGGVVSVETRAPSAGTSIFGSAEAGSFDTYRAAGGLNIGSDIGGLVLQSSYYDTNGTDSFAGGPVERDGYENLALSAKAVLHPANTGEFGIVARYTSTLSEFDGFDPLTFQRADTDDSTRIRSLALRGYAKLSTFDDAWRHELSGSYLTTDNINRRSGAFLNRTDAEIFKTGYQTGLDFDTGALHHRLTGAAEFQTQIFVADDDAYFGGTNQRKTRDRTSFILDYGVTAGHLSLTASFRQDENNRFADATTWRVGGRYALPHGFAVHGSAGKGVTDPTFTELFGFFPGSFLGNPALTPEKSFGWEAGIGYAGGGFNADITWFEADLENEILSTFDINTFLSRVANATGKSKRRGVEVSANVSPLSWLDLAASYTWLDADDGQVAGALLVREVRRARHNGSLSATVNFGPGDISLLANYVGKRRDIDFDSFPSRDVTLGDYVLASISGRYGINENLDLTARVENLFDERYQDVFGYQTQGISAFAGVRVRWGG